MKRSLILSLALIATPVFAKEIAFTDPSRSIEVTPSSTGVTLKIKSNPTTGYSWFLINYNESLLSPISHKYYAPTSQLVGASGYEIWQFRVNAAAFIMPQITTITLQSSRPWAVTANDHQSKFTIAINTTAKKK